MHTRENDEPLRPCTMGCSVSHYENCAECFGFGLYRGDTIKLAIANASMAMGDGLPEGKESIPCPLCRSTILGIPTAPRGLGDG